MFLCIRQNGSHNYWAELDQSHKKWRCRKCKSGVLVQKPLENVPCFSKMTLLLGCFLQFDGYMRRTKMGIIAAEWIAVLVLTPLILRTVDFI